MSERHGENPRRRRNIIHKHLRENVDGLYRLRTIPSKGREQTNKKLRIQDIGQEYEDA